jgi:SAM-dependent methyltransferase/predicted DsbA family dithiol-disulfide isomerase
LHEVYGDAVAIEYRMGGTFRDYREWQKQYDVDDESTVHWVHESVAMTGNPVDPGYFAKTRVTSTYPACTAFKAAERQDRRKAERYLRRMMEAFQVQAVPWSEENGVRLAQEVGLDPARLRADLHSKEVEQAFAQDMEAMRREHVNFLSLAVYAGGHRVVEGQQFDAGHFEAIIDRMAPGLPKRSPADLLEYLDKYPGDLVTAREIGQVFRIADGDAAARLQKLAAAGYVKAESHAGTTFWRAVPLPSGTIPLEVVKVSHVPPEARVETKADLTPIINAAVQSLYTQVANDPGKAYHFPLGLEALRYVGYPEGMLQKLPATATESFAGVGYPHQVGAIRPGNVVLDIGSGSGTDVLFSTLLAGPSGKVFGLDMTPAMIAKARRNIAAMGAGNAEILEGNATKIPLPDASVDVVTSNGVLNLVPDKAAAFAEIARVLKPGGRLQLADIVVQSDVAATCGVNPQLWADCIGGAAVESDYVAYIGEAGFRDVQVVKRLDYFAKSASDYTRKITKTFGAESVVVSAVKP